jgi:hypothetical protein
VDPTYGQEVCACVCVCVCTCVWCACACARVCEWLSVRVYSDALLSVLQTFYKKELEEDEVRVTRLFQEAPKKGITLHHRLIT